MPIFRCWDKIDSIREIDPCACDPESKLEKHMTRSEVAACEQMYRHSQKYSTLMRHILWWQVCIIFFDIAIGTPSIVIDDPF